MSDAALPRPPVPSGDVRPVPDPTTLTTAALYREIAALKEVIFTRIDAMDKAIAIFNENLTRVPTDVDKQVVNLKALHEERFNSIQVQFAERDTRAEQTARDSKVAVDAALQAAKEAVGEQNRASALSIAKSEAATTKQIDQITTLVQTTTAGLNDKIDDIKSRLTLIEGRGSGYSASWAIALAVVGTLLGVAGFVFAVTR